MNNLKIEIPEGNEIDVDKSSLENGLVVFKKIESKWPESWLGLEEIKGIYLSGDGISNAAHCDTMDHTKNVFPTKQDAESSLALAQLLQLRKAYVRDWVADWDCNHTKHSVYRFRNGLSINDSFNYYVELSFPTKEMAEHFLKHHKDLLETYFKLK